MLFDLKSFATFYVLILVLFACLLSIIDWGNFEFSDDPDVRFLEYNGSGIGDEYVKLSKFLARVVAILRISMGDLDFAASDFLNPFENHCFWFVLILSIIVTNVIFMNFIIAEVSTSYATVMAELDVTLLRERGGLINEAQAILQARFGKNRINEWTHLFP